MEQLVKVTSIPFQAIRFTQNARLIPADNVSLERQKALARHRAFQSRYRAAVSSIDLEYISKVKNAFSRKTTSGRSASSAPVAGSPPKGSVHHEAVSTEAGHIAPSSSGQISAASGESAYAIPSDFGAPAFHAGTPEPVAVTRRSVSPEASSAYAVQRGSFELRVARGELSYVPPLVMTIVTQYPDVQFEYTGGFHYVPPREDSLGSNMNLSI